MNPEFWNERWATGRIAFHKGEANDALVRHFDALALPAGARVFVPLCGKTRDIAWLLSRGCRVAGVELVRTAVEQLFDELGTEPARTVAGGLECFSAEGLDIFVGDIFDLSGEQLGMVDAVYDRAALVALPADMRSRYTAHLLEITRGAPQLLITYVYDQTLKDGPPFRVDAAEVVKHYGDSHDLLLLDSDVVEDGLDGVEAVRENWLLQVS